MSFDAGGDNREAVMTFTFSIIPRGVEPKMQSQVMFEAPYNVTIFEFAVETSPSMGTGANKLR